MTESFDLTPFVESLNMSYTVIPSDNENTYIRGFAFAPTETIEVVLGPMEAAGIELLLPRPQGIVRLEQRGKYWFDRMLDMSVAMKDLQINKETGEVTATYVSTNITDHSSQNWLARFLRWLLRRQW